MSVERKSEETPAAAVQWIVPDWEVPVQVRALTTTRVGGYSQGPYAGLNLADHLGDDPWHVERNRALLCKALALPQSPVWLNQVHGRTVLMRDDAGPESRMQAGDTAEKPEADACVSRVPGQVCAVLTADCLPVLLTDDEGSIVAAVHAGWRGLHEGVVDAAVEAMRCSAGRLSAWLGPAIGPAVYEVGAEVRQAFLDQADEAAQAFKAQTNGRYLANLYLLARQRLKTLGVERVSGGDYCSASEPDRFYSYRRDGRTGRMASLIWIEPQ